MRFVGLAFLGGAGCSVLLDLSQLSGTDASDDRAMTTADASVADAAAGDGGARCPPDMASIDDAFCIDKTEVTNARYKEFLAAYGTDASPGSAECAWNAGLGDGMKPGLLPAFYLYPRPETEANRPVRGISWCDAYCEWAGERLCGKVGGGRLDVSVLALDSNGSEWRRACGLRGVQDFPYGQTEKKGACRGYAMTAPSDYANQVVDVGPSPSAPATASSTRWAT